VTSLETPSDFASIVSMDNDIFCPALAPMWKVASLTPLLETAPFNKVSVSPTSATAAVFSGGAKLSDATTLAGIDVRQKLLQPVQLPLSKLLSRKYPLSVLNLVLYKID
jgi:hypothetical protein